VVHGGTDQLREQEVGAVARGYLNGIGHAGSRVQDDEAVSGRVQHPLDCGRGIGKLHGQGA